MCVALPGLLLGTSGADVTVIQVGQYVGSFDEKAAESKAWDDGKTMLNGDLTSGSFRAECRAVLANADVVLFSGEKDGNVYQALSGGNAAWLVVDSRSDDWELTVQARSGLMSLVTGPDSAPTFSAVPMVGYGTALSVYCSALAALYQRTVSTEDQIGYHLTMTEGLAATQAMLLRRIETPTMPGRPARTDRWQYQCSDGVWVHLNLLQQTARAAFRRLLTEVGAEPPETLDVAEADADSLVRDILINVPSGRLLELLSSCKVPGQPVLTPTAALADRDFSAMGLVSLSSHGRSVVRRAFVSESSRPKKSFESPAIDPGRADTAMSPSIRSDDDGERSPGMPLTGVLVVDAGVYLAGPYAAFILSQLGARVVKLESTQGDPLRKLPDLFVTCNVGKESISVDFSAPSGRSAVERLLREADVLHHNIRPETASKLGLDPSTCAAINPQLIYSRISAFGHLGDRSKEPGFDQTFQALSGVEVAFGGSDKPMWHPSSLCDISAGWLAAAAVVESLIVRARTGRIQSVHTPAVAGGLLAVSGFAYRNPGAFDLPLAGLRAGYRIYRCADNRWVACVIGSPDVWVCLADSIPGLDPEQVVLSTRQGERAAESVIAQFANTLTAEAFVTMVQESGGRAEIVRGRTVAPPRMSHAEDYVHEHFRQLGPEARLGFRDPKLGWVEVAGFPGTWTHNGQVIRRRVARPPLLGEHNESIVSASADEHALTVSKPPAPSAPSSSR
jgi:crotonobetainyl-CoA:carnitine CoA-transferase CaiB-like acyl-CoA transferase